MFFRFVFSSLIIFVNLTIASSLDQLPVPQNKKVQEVYYLENNLQRIEEFENLLESNHLTQEEQEEAKYYYLICLVENNSTQKIVQMVKSWQNKVPSINGAIIAIDYLIDTQEDITWLYPKINLIKKQDQDKKYFPLIEYLRGNLLYKKGMKGAAFQTLQRQAKFFAQKQDFTFFYRLGKIAYEIEKYEDAIYYLSNAYNIKPETNLQTLMELSAQKMGLNSEEKKQLFSRLMKQPLEEAYEFSLEDIDGNTFTLSEMKGKFVLITFWASWCGPCRYELPILEKLYQEKIENLVILGINIENDAEKCKRMRDKMNLSFPLLPDNQFVQQKYNVSSIPRAFLINQDGYIVLKMIGAVKNIDQVVKERIKFFSQQ